jgi:hypothetical protein
VSDVDAAASAKITKECVCNNDLFWKAADNACAVCSTIAEDAKDKCGAVGTSCWNWRWDVDAATPTCTDDCPATGTDLNTQYKMIDRTCICQMGYFWNSTDISCTACENADKTSCSVETCLGYFWTLSKCHTCRTLFAVTDTNLVAPPEESNGLAIDGICECASDYLWNSTTFKCDGCGTKGENECGLGACSNFFLRNKSCMACAKENAVPRDGATPLTACKCNTGYIWFNVTNKCEKCSPSTSVLNSKTGLCIVCSNLTNG